GLGRDDAQAELAAALEAKASGSRILRDGGDDSALRAHRELARAVDARARALEELAVHRDAPGADDLAVGEHAVLADDQLGLVADMDRAVVEQAVDLDAAARFEAERRVAQGIAAAEEAAAALGGGRRLGERARADREHRRD